MAKLLDRAKMTVTGVPGTGNVQLGVALQAYQSFAGAGLVDGDQFSYLIQDAGSAWEIGVGTYIASTTSFSRAVTKSTASPSTNPIAASSAAIVTATLRAEDVAAVTTLASMTDVVIDEADLTDNDYLGWSTSLGSFVAKPAAASGRTAIVGTYTMLATDVYVAVTALTGAATITLPAANSVAAGTVVIIADEAGVCSQTNTITVARAGADKICGLGSTFPMVLNSPSSYAQLISDGSGNWTVIGRSEYYGLILTSSTYAPQPGMVSIDMFLCSAGGGGGGGALQAASTACSGGAGGGGGAGKSWTFTAAQFGAFRSVGIGAGGTAGAAASSSSTAGGVGGGGGTTNVGTLATLSGGGGGAGGQLNLAAGGGGGGGFINTAGAGSGATAGAGAVGGGAGGSGGTPAPAVTSVIGGSGGGGGVNGGASGLSGNAAYGASGGGAGGGISGANATFAGGNSGWAPTNPFPAHALGGAAATVGGAGVAAAGGLDTFGSGGGGGGSSLTAAGAGGVGGLGGGGGGGGGSAQNSGAAAAGGAGGNGYVSSVERFS